MSDGDGITANNFDAKVTCYSGGESSFMNWSQELRGRLLRPLLRHMTLAGLRANHVTLLSLIAGLAFCPLYLWGSKPAAFGLLLLHALLDGLDGPLARFRGTASNRGSFTDTMADQLVVTATTLAAIHAGAASAWPGGLYIFFYAVVVGFAMVRNALAAPYSWLFRPRFVVYASLLVETWWLPGTLDSVLWTAAAVLAFKTLTGFLTIRRRI